MNSAQILREAFEDPINFHECGTAEPSYFRWQRFVPWTYIRNVVITLFDVVWFWSCWIGRYLLGFWGKLYFDIDWKNLPLIGWPLFDASRLSVHWLGSYKGYSGRTQCFEDPTSSMIVFCFKGLDHVYRDGMTRLNLAHQTQGSLWEEEFSTFGRKCKTAGCLEMWLESRAMYSTCMSWSFQQLYVFCCFQCLVMAFVFSYPNLGPRCTKRQISEDLGGLILSQLVWTLPEAGTALPRLGQKLATEVILFAEMALFR